MIFHSAQPQEVVSELGSNQYTGLDGSEADRRLKRYGENLTNTSAKPSFAQILLNQFKSIPLAILLGAAFIWMITGLFLDLGNPWGAVAVLVIALFSVAIGMVKQYFSRRVLGDIRNATSPTARVLRDGEE